MSFLMQSAIFLGAAVVAVPLARRLGLGAILGYLAAGIVIGPGGAGLIGNAGDVLHVAEFGVVLLLFVIGLELQPARLWSLRRLVFGLGGAQLLGTGAVLTLAGWLLGLAPAAAVLVGLVLALSSTAFGLQILAEKKQLAARHGRIAFAVLLFQDLAVIPLLALIPILGGGTGEQDLVWPIAKAVAMIALLVIGGRYLLRYLLRAVAISRTPEVFTAMALFTVVAAALLMQAVGLSAALGAFLAGVLLADSEYRHALEADIEPFKGLLLGLFFIAVGMSVDVGLVLGSPLAILGLVAGLMAVKGLALYIVGRAGRLRPDAARRLATVLPQGGEFAFVLFAVAAGAGALDQGVADLLVVVVAISMAATPLAVAINEAISGAIDRRRAKAAPPPAYDMPPEDNQVIIAGFGRFGQIVGRILRARRIPFTALEISPEQVDFVRRFGNEVHYGDASRLDLLRAAKADKAAVFVLAIDDVEASVRTATVVAQHFPNLAIHARARNRAHAYRLMDHGVKIIRRETFHSSLELAGEVLKATGLAPSEADRVVATFRAHDVARLYEQYPMRADQDKMILQTRQWAEELEEMFAQDAADEAEEEAAAD